jgi:hypothetical protein
MPEPNINLLYISEDDFDNLFFSVLQQLIDNIKYNNAHFKYNFSIIRTIPNLDLNSQLQRYNYVASSIYDYFDIFYDDFYDYNWIISLIKKCEAYPRDFSNRRNLYKKRIKFNNLEYSMIQIIQLVMSEFNKYLMIIID